MKPTLVYLAPLAEPTRALVRAAVREAFPRGQLVPVGGVKEALEQPDSGRQLLVLGEASEVDIGVAAQALSRSELPRWAVVQVSETASDLVETVPPAECSVALLARVFHSALLHHELLRENLQLRGDLKTISRRFNHDLRTPLGCIDAAGMLLRELTAAGTQPPHETIATIRGSVAEINTLLDRVSLVLRASSDPLPAQPIAMGSVVQRIVAGLSPAPGRPAVKFRQPGQWPEARGVEPWIEFVWASLVQNALRHGRGHAVQLGWEPRGTEQRFWVSSDGAVPASLRANLFHPFHLLHQRTSAGLGLSLVERLVSLHGGSCGYESTPDNHALFYFTLPAAHGSPEPSAPAPATGVMSTGRGP